MFGFVLTWPVFFEKLSRYMVAYHYSKPLELVASVFTKEQTRMHGRDGITGLEAFQVGFHPARLGPLSV